MGHSVVGCRYPDCQRAECTEWLLPRSICKVAGKRFVFTVVYIAVRLIGHDSDMHEVHPTTPVTIYIK